MLSTRRESKFRHCFCKYTDIKKSHTRCCFETVSLDVLNRVFFFRQGNDAECLEIYPCRGKVFTAVVTYQKYRQVK